MKNRQRSSKAPEFHFYKEHPKTCDREDFWGQVKRTVNGKPVSQDQIDMIVDAVKTGLELEKDDVLLDLCCGNGALSRLLFESCAGGVGVDYSEVLISVAKEYFEASPREVYVLQDAVEFLSEMSDPGRYTKAVCYGSIQYLPRHQADELLRLLRERCTGIRALYIGNVPDKAHIDSFFRPEEYREGMENDPCSMIGIMRTQEEFSRLAASCGWKASFHSMPRNFFAAHYRYDVLMVPATGE
jgi:SAM-dependent methyltransferase